MAASGIYPALDAIANDEVVNITALKWVMPSVTPSLDKQLELLEVIKNKETVTLAFLNKRLESINVSQATIFN